MSYNISADLYEFKWNQILIWKNTFSQNECKFEQHLITFKMYVAQNTGQD